MSDALDSSERPESLSRQIYSILREGIITGRYPQGARLAEQRLAEELDVSRVPLREAIPQLEVDGFVRTVPRRGAVVSTWSVKAANDLFDLRLCLEVGAAGYAARQVSNGASAGQLKAVLDRGRGVMASHDAYRIAQESTRFHETIVDMTENALMRSLMRSVSGRMMWLFFLTTELDPFDAYDGHLEIYRSIASGNQRVAEAVAYAHIERDRDESLGFLDQLGGGESCRNAE
ncbi:DNA-binding GntR family transcriptional regulator [Jatrophihabitans sp. GAS493]|uniref:GntR family transcriptional regulator n=1 Tax=Jatrophihabitans sp. GAS493 TaxID=1907575 RepID=UPI000BB7AF2B|nr:GntR family transcriptional regulator [Jatrophihabitans sp. GAS493]SOD74818.1 DNA-binding GntR family transcriptional regulator [Jatrophihabitans sp. GAS493]